MLVTRRSYVFKLVPPYGANNIHTCSGIAPWHAGHTYELLILVCNRKYQAPKRHGDPQPALNNRW